MPQLPRSVERQGGIDPAALAAATLAAAVSVISPPGPYNPGSSLIGVVVLAVIVGFDHEPIRHRGESFAYSSVFGLILWLAIAYPVEIVFSGVNDIGNLHGLDAVKARIEMLFVL
ncbi:MAG TPA: hypothetical protein VHI32_00225 [Burkholderiales bacterium]|nr:hypothetical protein [Burkholderiales bacterium]